VTDLYKMECKHDLVILFLVFCGDFANLCCEIKVRSLYRQTGSITRLISISMYDLGTWRRYNPWEEKEKY
jgi:hypothetical protein